MRMLLLAASAAATFLSASAQAETAEAKSFSFDGVTYTYTVTEKGAARVIQGKTDSLAGSFRLALVNGRVTGHFGGQPVAFRAADAKGAFNKGGAELIALLTK